MDKETTEETTENTAILEGVHAEQFRLRIVTNEQGKQEYQVVKLETTGNSGMVMSNVPVTLPDNVTMHVDHAGRLTLQVSGPIDGLGDLGGGGEVVSASAGVGEMPTTPFKKSSPMMVMPGAETPSIRTVDGVLQMGRVSSIMGNVTDCLRIMPDVDPLDCINAAMQVTPTVPSTTSANANFTDVIADIQDSMQQESHPCTMNLAAVQGAVGSVDSATETLTVGDPMVTSEALIGSSVRTMTVMANMNWPTGSEVACSLSGSVPVDPISLPSLVSIGVPNVELTTTGQLVISRGSLMYSDQSSNLLALDAPNPDADGTIKPNTAETTVIDPSVQDANQPAIQPKVKRKGGWPKGKKRKTDSLNESNFPKAPTTAYSSFLNEQLGQIRKKHSKKPFPEIIKILGSMWTKMTIEEKKKYLTVAELDKKRYIEELRAFQHSETYQTLLRRQVAKKIKDLTGVDGATIDPDVSASVLNEIQLEEDDPSDLLCKICDKLFSTVHNKKEHMYGKQHLLTLTGKLCQIEKEVLEMESNNQQLSHSTLLDPNQGLATGPSLHHGEGQATGTSGLPGTGAQQPAVTEKIDIDQFKEGFMELNLDREIELRELRCRDQELFEVKMELSQQYQELEETLAKQKVLSNNLKRVSTTLRAKLEDLRMVPTLFGVINF
ncbi:uncharacterized protein LOC117295097 [Asterias rubens]|uniref:uncharacterized protein LOC117295097 n=1 Tax=Asterias rubens TaxID=7604 RepID=UPI0014557602|nr:uncharacterized protein LOC117295097 [Asterias rubens]